MAISYMDYTSPKVQYTYDLSNNTIFKKNPQNYINGLGIKQLNTDGNIFLLDIHLSKGNVVEPHSHPNATEVLYCISGAVTASLINPFTNELKNFPIKPGEVVSFPQGWQHYAMATEDRTHVLSSHDTPELQTVWTSDLLRLLPDEVLAHTYCLDLEKIKDALRPITERVVIGPPENCKRENNSSDSRAYSSYHYQPPGMYYGYPYYMNQPYWQNQ